MKKIIFSCTMIILFFMPAILFAQERNEENQQPVYQMTGITVDFSEARITISQEDEEGNAREYNFSINKETKIEGKVALEKTVTITYIRRFRADKRARFIAVEIKVEENGQK